MFYTIFHGLDLCWGHRVNGIQNLLDSFSRTFFQLIRMKFDGIGNFTCQCYLSVKCLLSGEIASVLQSVWKNFYLNTMITDGSELNIFLY